MTAGLTTSSSPLTLRKVVGNPLSKGNAGVLRLAMLGCEDDPPYGPTEHTGKLLLELIAQCVEETIASNDAREISISIFRVKNGDYPNERDADTFDGWLLPGSFAAAYDSDPWIEKLKKYIQEELVSKQRPTIGICFGHQLLAHSYTDGKAKKNPAGSRGGRFSMSLTKAGSYLFGGKESIDLYYTHGDQVDQLPACAIALGHESDLPAQSAAYFKDQAELQRFLSGSNPAVKPFAVTFQAHPEYAILSHLGLEFTLNRILNTMVDKDLLPSEVGKASKEDARLHFHAVQRESKDVFIASARALGWF